MLRTRIAALCLPLLLLVVSTSYGQTIGVNKDGTTGLIFTDSAETLDEGYVNVGLFLTYMHHDIADFIDEEYEVNAVASIGLLDRMELAVRQPWILYRGEEDLDGFTDMTVSLKYGFLQESKDDPFGLAVKTFGIFPTGETSDGLSRDDFDFGVLGVVSKRLGDFELIANAGGVWTGNTDIAIRSTGDQEDFFTSNAAVVYHVNDQWSVFNEWHFDTRTINESHPIDGTLGFRYLMNDRMAVTGGATLAMNDASPDVQGHLGVTYAFGPLWGREKPEPTPTPKAIVTPEPMPATPTPTPTPEPEPVPTELPPLPVFKILYFEFDKSNILPAAAEELDKVARILKDNPNYNLRIEGHASKVGTLEYNQALSERRAKSVKDFLVNRKNVDADRLQTYAYGETRPAVPQSENERQPLNRRVEMVVIRIAER